MEYTLNYIQGFDPQKYVEDATDKIGEPIYQQDGSPLRYMSTDGKKLWFRLKHPNGAIVSRREDTSNPGCVRYRVEVYEDKNDPCPIASWEHQETTSAAEDLDMLASKVQTIALGKALSAAGFGAEIEAELHLKAEGEPAEMPKVENLESEELPKANDNAEAPEAEESKEVSKNIKMTLDEALDFKIQPTDLARSTKVKRLEGKTFREVLSVEATKDIPEFFLKPGNMCQVTPNTIQAAQVIIKSRAS